MEPGLETGPYANEDVNAAIFDGSVLCGKSINSIMPLENRKVCLKNDWKINLSCNGILQSA